MDMKMALDLGDVGSVHVQNEANFRLRLGIPDGKYDLNLIFPPGSEKAPFLKNSQAYSIVVALGSCPSLSTDNGSDSTSTGSVALSRSSTFPIEKPSSSGRRGFGNNIKEVGDMPHVDPEGVNSLETFDTDFSTSGDDDTDDESEQFDSVQDLILAAFRGEPDIPPDVRRILHRESPAFSALAIGTEGTVAGQPSQEPATPQKKPSKRRRSSQGDDDLGDKAPSKARVRIAHNKAKPLAQLKFSCVFHKKFPHIYCTRTSIGGADKFYEPCSGTGWTEIRHLVKHYSEKHGRPQCLNCLEIFANTQALTTHQREAMCFQTWDRSTEEPIDPAVMERIKQACRSAKVEAPWTKEEIRWFKICFILFPLSEPPNSPYIGQEGEIRLIRATIDSLENRIQENPSSPSSMDLRSIIDDLQAIIWRLGPALEEAELLQQRQTARPVAMSDIDLNIDPALEDPAVQLWNNRDMIADMPDNEELYDG